MSTLTFFKNVVMSIWSGMETIIVPLINIPVTSLLVGLFVVGIAIGILNPLLGIGGGIVDSFVSGAHRSASRANARAASRAAYNRRAAKVADNKVRDVSRWV